MAAYDICSKLRLPQRQRGALGFWTSRLLSLMLLAGWLAFPLQAVPQGAGGLAAARTKSGTIVLRAFASTVRMARDSVVRFDVNDQQAALGAIVDTNGLAITKASEVTKGELTCKLASGRSVVAEIVAVDDENDLALVKVHASGLRPIQWESRPVVIGQWAITPGIDSTPEAVGIVSVRPRKISPKQAFLGVRLSVTANVAKIDAVTKGLGAEKAGLTNGDVIVTINGVPVKDGQAVKKELLTYREGQSVKLQVQRGTNLFEATAPMMKERRGFNRQDRMNRLGGELSQRAEGFDSAIQHDTVLQPWQCGGPLLDLDGKAVGLNIARAGRVASYALPASLVQSLVQELEEETKILVGHEAGEPGAD